MRNYYFSVVVHVVILLIVLMFPFSSEIKHRLNPEHLIVIDFREDKLEIADNEKKELVKSTNLLPFETKTEQSKETNKADLPKKSKVKSKTSPAPKSLTKAEAKTDKAAAESPIKVKESEIELAKEQAQKEKEKQKSAFKALLSKSSDYSAQNSTNTKANAESEGLSQNKAQTSSSNHSDLIKGELGTRKVIKVPSIKDDSQKKGKVIVKICVNANGDVISAHYTLKGSTTSDSYLISLAEKGVLGYKFSKSTAEKECGEVEIVFLLK